MRGLVKTGELPAFSAVVESGRGLWLLWLLHDERDSSQAHLGAYDDNRTNHLQLHRKINQKQGSSFRKWERILPQSTLRGTFEFQGPFAVTSRRGFLGVAG